MNRRMKRGLAVVLAVVVLVAVVLAGRFWRGSLVGASVPDSAEPSGHGDVAEVRVVLTPAEERDFEESLRLQGSLEAQQFAMVPAVIGGTIERFYVDEGDAVVAGETKLFEVDALKLEKAVEVRCQELAVARSALKEKEALREQVQADFHKADLDYARFQRLFDRGAVPEDVLEQQESRFKQSKAMVKHAQSLVELSMEQRRQAEAALEMAEKDLRDTTAVAPISGKVSARYYELGEMAEGGKAVLRIDDPAVLEVSAFMPSQCYARVRPGQTLVHLEAEGQKVGAFPISYKSPTIHPKLRTFEIKCVVKDPPEGVVPGAIANIRVVMDHRRALGVPSAALQERSGGFVVFVVENDVAHEVQVTKGMETEGWSELTGGSVSAGDSIVSMGQYHLNDGARVSVMGGGA